MLRMGTVAEDDVDQDGGGGADAGRAFAQLVGRGLGMAAFAIVLEPCMDGSRVTRGSAIFGNWSGAAMYSASRLRFARAP
ncbi:hypothetical protein [Cereibacter azotoformans]|uniref:hypothetical protein n=1 Tax=Cereibacter azotoformans TaxID=43057 RepID=UPI000C6E0A0D|nr:hypothetical protein [Cereibacter azotoformans]